MIIVALCTWSWETQPKNEENSGASEKYKLAHRQWREATSEANRKEQHKWVDDEIDLGTESE